LKRREDPSLEGKKNGENFVLVFDAAFFRRVYAPLFHTIQFYLWHLFGLPSGQKL
jgi:hypothetical protein